MDAQQVDNLPAVANPAEQEALAQWLPQAGFVFKFKDGQTQTVFTPQLWADICQRYAEGEVVVNICKSYGIPRSLVWNWASIPELAEQWREARKYHSHAIIDDAVRSLKQLRKGSWISEMADPTGKTLYAYTKAITDSVKLSMEMAGKLNPDDYSDRLQVDQRQVSYTYVVGLTPGPSIGSDADHQAAISVPAPDSAGVERAALPQAWRKDLSRERKRKRESSNQDE